MSSPLSAFYINLDRRLDRREYFEGQLRHVGIEAERVSAVTPADLPADAIEAARGNMSATELACSFSHRKIWRLMHERGLEAALILEDDAVLSTALPRLLATTDLVGRVDALQLESHPSDALLGPARPADGGVTIHRLMSSSLGTCAYYITTRFALQVLEHPLLDQLAIDRVLFGRGGGTIYRARIYQSVPALAVQLDTITPPQDGAARSDLAPVRKLGSGNKRGLSARLSKISGNVRHLARIAGSFAPSGELFGARQVKVPAAEDITARF